MNNRGSSIVDVLFISVVLLALGISVIVLHNIFDEANNQIQDNNRLSADSKQFADDQNTAFPNVMDKFFLIIFIGLGISLFVGAFLLQTHPAFFIFTVIILAFFVVVAAILGNVYEEFIAGGDFSSIESNYLVIPFVFSNFTMIILGLGVLLLVGLFAKSRGDPV